MLLIKKFIKAVAFTYAFIFLMLVSLIVLLNLLIVTIR